jgi:hypothetical protein
MHSPLVRCAAGTSFLKRIAETLKKRRRQILGIYFDLPIEITGTH